MKIIEYFRQFFIPWIWEFTPINQVIVTFNIFGAKWRYSMMNGDIILMKENYGLWIFLLFDGMELSAKSKRQKIRQLGINW